MRQVGYLQRLPKFISLRLYNLKLSLRQKLLKVVDSLDVLWGEINIGRFIMFSGITKNYYRKTVGHVITKPVQTEGTNKIFFFQ